MGDKPVKRYLFASDFDRTLTFNDSGYILSELLGIPVADFERKAEGMARLNLVQLGAELQVGPDNIIYVGAGNSDLHVMLNVNVRDAFTIAVSETRHVAQVAKRTVLSSNVLATLVPILEKIVGWQRPEIRNFLESHGLLVQEWDRVRTDWLTLRPATAEPLQAASAD